VESDLILDLLPLLLRHAPEFNGFEQNGFHSDYFVKIVTIRINEINISFFIIVALSRARVRIRILKPCNCLTFRRGSRCTRGFLTARGYSIDLYSVQRSLRQVIRAT
jgi:hypothetical protein